jgi:hypothetical protein
MSLSQCDNYLDAGGLNRRIVGKHSSSIAKELNANSSELKGSKSLVEES